MPLCDIFVYIADIDLTRATQVQDESEPGLTKVFIIGDFIHVQVDMPIIITLSLGASLLLLLPYCVGTCVLHRYQWHVFTV